MTISTIGTSSRNYSTIQAWENACPVNITAAGTNEIWRGECYNDSEFLVAGTVLTVGGITTDATHYLHLLPAAGHSFIDYAGAAGLPLRYDQSKGVGIRCTGTYSKIIDSLQEYFVIENMQIRSDSASGNTNIYVCRGDNSTYRNCIFEWHQPIGPFPSSHPPTFINCVIVRLSVNQTGQIFSGPIKFYNCTIVRPSDLGLSSSTGVFLNLTSFYPTVKNCAIFGPFGTPFFAGTLASYTDSDYNASSESAASMPGSNNQGSLTFADQFEVVTNTNRDWRPKSTGALVENATRDQTNTNDLDILNAARSITVPTIGAREYKEPVTFDLASLTIDAFGRATLVGDPGSFTRYWRMPSSAAQGTSGRLLVFAAGAIANAVAYEGAVTADANGNFDLATSNLVDVIGTKRFAVFHAWNGSTSAVSIYGGPGVSELIQVS